MVMKNSIIIVLFLSMVFTVSYASEFDLKNANAGEALKIIERETGYKITGGDRLKGNITLSTGGRIAPDEAYETFNRWLMGLKPALTAVKDPEARSINIVLLSDIIMEKIRVFNNPAALPDSSEVVKVIKVLDKVSADGVEPLIAAYKSGWGSIIINKKMNSLVIVDEMKKVNLMLAKLEELQKTFYGNISSLRYKVFKCKYTSVKETAMQIMMALGFSKFEIEEKLNITINSVYNIEGSKQRKTDVNVTIDESKNLIYVAGFDKDAAIAENVFKLAEEETEELYNYRLKQWVLSDVYIDSKDNGHRAVFMNRADNKKIILKKGELFFPESKMKIKEFVQDGNKIKVIIETIEECSVGKIITVK